MVLRKIEGKYYLKTSYIILEEKRDTLKIIASVEKRDIKAILSELIYEYMKRNKEPSRFFPVLTEMKL